MVCPTGPGGFVFQWFAQRVWRGFRILLQWSAQRAREDSFFNGSTNGSVFQWSAQRGRIRFSMVCPTGLGGFGILFQWSTGLGGFVFQWFAQRVERRALRVGSAPAPGTLPGGHFWQDPAPAQVGSSCQEDPAILVLVGSGLVGGTRAPRAPRAPGGARLRGWPRGPWQGRALLGHPSITSITSTTSSNTPSIANNERRRFSRQKINEFLS